MSTPLNTAKEFWERVDQSGDCWTWQGCKTHNGYGFFKFQGKQWRTHRLAYLFTRGSIPDGLQVNHHCDNPACVKPGHLYVGDQKQNRQDAILRGRTAKGERNGMYTHPESRSTGERNGNHKLTDKQWAEIRWRYAQGNTSLGRLAREYGVSKPTVSYQVKRGI